MARVLLLAFELLADTCLTLARLVGGDLLEILHAVERADLDLAGAEHRVRAALHPFDRFVERLHLPDPVAGDELLGLGERAVDHGAVLAVELDARALAARLQAVAGEHDAQSGRASGRERVCQYV